jgi:hypothetical protein
MVHITVLHILKAPCSSVRRLGQRLVKASQSPRERFVVAGHCFGTRITSASTKIAMAIGCPFGPLCILTDQRGIQAGVYKAVERKKSNNRYVVTHVVWYDSRSSHQYHGTQQPDRISDIFSPANFAIIQVWLHAIPASRVSG